MKHSREMTVHQVVFMWAGCAVMTMSYSLPLTALAKSAGGILIGALLFHVIVFTVNRLRQARLDRLDRKDKLAADLRFQKDEYAEAYTDVMNEIIKWNDKLTYPAETEAERKSKEDV